MTLLRGLGFASLFAAGVAVGAVAMIYAYPRIFPPWTPGDGLRDGAQLFFQGHFREAAPGANRAHWGRGGMRAWRSPKGPNGEVLLEFEANFEVTPGPGYWVYLNSRPDIEDARDFKGDSGRLRLAKLKKFKGSQIYHVAPGIFSRAQAVTVWCESFDQFIASGNLVGQ